MIAANTGHGHSRGGISAGRVGQNHRAECGRGEARVHGGADTTGVRGAAIIEAEEPVFCPGINGTLLDISTFRTGGIVFIDPVILISITGWTDGDWFCFDGFCKGFKVWIGSLYMHGI